MVVLTALLVKAAYDRYNNNNKNSERFSNNNNITTATASSSSSSVLPPPRISPRRFQHRSSKQHPRRHKSQSSSISNNKSNNSLDTNGLCTNGAAIKFTREHSFRLLQSLGSSSPSPYSDCYYGNNDDDDDDAIMMKPSYHHQDHHSTTTTVVSQKTSSSSSMHYTRHGNYILDTKRGVLTLPPPPPLSSINSDNEGTSKELTEAIMLVGDDNNHHHHHGHDHTGDHDDIIPKDDDVQQTTFRNDIRNEWIDAIFGKDFYPLPNPSSNDDNDDHFGNIKNVQKIIGIQQGVGAANIPHYVTYGAIVDPAATTTTTTTTQQRTLFGTNLSSSGTGGSSSSLFGTIQQQQSSNSSQSHHTTISTPRKVVQSKTQSTPILLQEDGDDPSIVTYQGTTTTTNGYGDNNGGYQTPLRNGDDDYNYYQQQQQHLSSSSTTTTTFFPAMATIPISSTSSNNNSSTSGSILNNNTHHHHNNNNNNNNNKLGITISRIPLGLYIKSISYHCEGYSAGISPGSILVSVNGMGMLGERSDRALERLWLYAGLFVGNGSGGGENNGNNLRDGFGRVGGGGVSSLGGGGKSDSVNKNNTMGRNNVKNSSSSNNDLNSGMTPNNSLPPSSSSTLPLSPDDNNNLQVKRPIQLTLYKSGRVYTVLLLSGHPLSGIEWAPCGNFALVQRVVSGGAGFNAGVRRGTIVCAVDGESLRSLDHVGVARKLRSKFLCGERMVIGLGYTPAASRSTFMEREDNGGGGGGVESNTPSTGMRRSGSRSHSPIPTTEGGVASQSRRGNSSQKKNMKKKKNYEHYVSVRDVEVRSRPMEYSTAISETLFACTGPSAMGTVMEDRNDSSVGGSLGRFNHGDVANSISNLASGIADVAAYVAAGGILPPGGVSVAVANIATIRNRAMLANQVAGVSGSRRSYQPPPSNFGPCPTLAAEQLLEKWNPLASLVQSMLYHAAGCCETRYVEMGGPFESGVDTKDAAYSVTECIHVIQRIATSSSAAETVFDGHLLQLLGVATSPTMANKEMLQSSEAIFDILVEVAMTNISLCQRLFFLLRSFIGVVEIQKAEYYSEITVIALKLLRYAQRSLSGRMFDKSVCLEEGRQGSFGYPMNRESSSSNDIKQQYARDQCAQLTIPASESAKSPASMESPDGVDSLPILFGGSSLGSTSNENLQHDTNQLSKKKGKSKKILKLFKKRSLKIPPTSDQSIQTKSPERAQAKSFTFPNVFNKNVTQSRESNDEMSMTRQFENMAWILRQIDSTCSAIEKNLMKSFSQKVADWALWSSSKESALASVTQSFRSDLRLMNNSSQSSSSAEKRFPILNPLDPAELLTSVDANECFILPSAHFPLLLCFDSQPNTVLLASQLQNERSHNEGGSHDVLYRTKVEILGLSGTRVGTAFSVQGSVAGVIQESSASNNTLIFETKSNWGYPKTLSLKVSSLSVHHELTIISDDKNQNDLGCGFVDLCPVWQRVNEGRKSSYITAKTRIYTFDSAEEFDQHGEVDRYTRGSIELHLRVSAEIVAAGELPQKCLLLYKHGDDLRQELLAIQFIERCNEILKASGLDLKLKTFRCLPVGAQKGFIEWVEGTVPLSELCNTSGLSHSGSNPDLTTDDKHFQSGNNQADTPQPHRRSWCKYQSLRGLRQQSNGSLIGNPIQDFLRSAAFDDSAPYFVKKDVMDTYVKSCAGFCVITYLLGVGDRHLDNILLHQNGHLLHCDYSFILGHDPKTYMPMRITDEMVMGFGGRESDNFARFLSFTGAAFLTLRRHNNLRSLLSHVRLMVDSNMVDVSIHQSPEEAILAMRGRFRLDLNDDDALTYIEDVVEKSITSKLWKAVDVIHSIGMHF